MGAQNDFERLYFDHRLKMFLLAKSILHNDHDAEDVVHDVFLNVALKHRETVMNTYLADLNEQAESLLLQQSY